MKAWFVVSQFGGRWYVVQHPRGIIVPKDRKQAHFATEGEARKAAAVGVER